MVYSLWDIGYGLIVGLIFFLTYGMAKLVFKVIELNREGDNAKKLADSRVKTA